MKVFPSLNPSNRFSRLGFDCFPSLIYFFFSLSKRFQYWLVCWSILDFYVAEKVLCCILSSRCRGICLDRHRTGGGIRLLRYPTGIAGGAGEIEAVLPIHPILTAGDPVGFRCSVLFIYLYLWIYYEQLLERWWLTPSLSSGIQFKNPWLFVRSLPSSHCCFLLGNL